MTDLIESNSSSKTAFHYRSSTRLFDPSVNIGQYLKAMLLVNGKTLGNLLEKDIFLMTYLASNPAKI